MFFLIVSMIMFTRHRWTIGCIIYSIAVGVKMNVLLTAPALLYILLASHGYSSTLWYLTLCAMVQLALGAPFLLTAPLSYIKRSFDLGRQVRALYLSSFIRINQNFVSFSTFGVSIGNLCPSRYFFRNRSVSHC